MDTFKKIALFFSCNIAGFYLPLFFYPFCLKTKIIDLQAEDFDISSFFMNTTKIPDIEANPMPIMIFFPILAWIFCALFSFTYFFVGKKWKRVFLIAPLAMPLVLSLLILIRFI